MGMNFGFPKVKYPPIGVVVADTISGGHDMIFLDYRTVVLTVNLRLYVCRPRRWLFNYSLADNFGDFIKNLYISIEEITDEEFQSLSDAEKVKLLNEQGALISSVRWNC